MVDNYQLKVDKMILTINESKVLRFLAVNTQEKYSINECAKRCNISPYGVQKIFMKFAKEGVLKVKNIGNMHAYFFDFDNEKTKRILELAFIPYSLGERIELRKNDLAQLRDITQICVLFGSYITKKKDPNDFDVLMVLEEKYYPRYKKALAVAQEIIPFKIHDVVQTMRDLEKNLKERDPVVLSALQKGILLWGYSTLVKVIQRVARRET